MTKSINHERISLPSSPSRTTAAAAEAAAPSPSDVSLIRLLCSSSYASVRKEPNLEITYFLPLPCDGDQEQGFSGMSIEEILDCCLDLENHDFGEETSLFSRRNQPANEASSALYNAPHIFQKSKQ